LSDRENGPLSDDQIVGVIVEGITDCDISEIDGGAQRTIDDLRAMLAGVDIQGSEYPQVEIAPFPKSEAATKEAERSLDRQRVEKQPDREQEEKQQDKSQAKSQGERELDRKLRVHAEELAARSSKREATPP